MAAFSQAKGKERADPPITHSSQLYPRPQADNFYLPSGQPSQTFDVVNDFGGISDHDEDQGEEYIHAKSSPLKDGRRLDNQVSYKEDLN